MNEQTLQASTTCTETPLYEKIIEIVADCCLVKTEQLKSSERGERNIGDARHIAIALIGKYCPEMRLKQIGAIFGLRHHSTIIHSLKTAEDLCDSNKEFRRKFECSKVVIKNMLEDGE